jgi:hypothetical protein
MMRGPTVVVLGTLGRLPFAGTAWQALHYLEGLRRLDCDIYYVEDTGEWPYDFERNTVSEDCSYTIGYISRLASWCGLSERWAYRAASQGGRIHGLSERRLAELFGEADILINLTGATLLRDEHLRVPVRIYLETDPVVPQIEVAKGRRRTIDLLGAHTHRFTYGENLGRPDCGVPLGRFVYQPTRQPVILDWWAAAAARPPRQAAWQADSGAFTTVANWKQDGKDVEWRGETYTWSKHHEFLKLLDLPKRTAQPLELALSAADGEAIRLLASHGWRTADAMSLSKDIGPYRDYILTSRGEFTVAKDQNVRLRSGWFSDRSACYLAAGRPVVTQETGFSSVLPTGRGLFAFRTIDEILAAFDEIASDYSSHRRAAREIAAAYFSADGVIRRLIEQSDSEPAEPTLRSR